MCIIREKATVVSVYLYNAVFVDVKQRAMMLMKQEQTILVNLHFSRAWWILCTVLCIVGGVEKVGFQVVGESATVFPALFPGSGRVPSSRGSPVEHLITVVFVW